MTFYLGTHMPNWLEKIDVPLFVSRRRLHKRKTLPTPRGQWALDSGAFTEIKNHGRYTFTEAEYVADVRRFHDEMPGLQWVAPMDWMCEPFILAKTGLTVTEHIRLTVENFLRLRDELGSLVIPVLQGWTVDDYVFCAKFYEVRGVDLIHEPLVGVGSICRRNRSSEVSRILRTLRAWAPNLHGFGVKGDGLYRNLDILTSADSMAWSSAGRRDHIRGHSHKNCANCLTYALRWRTRWMQALEQGRLECAA